ncbi:nitroreductase family protein [Geobacter argillaceus]|uniref:Nitroreductase family protein n=1 Tax=Geobacter argillaceus TaxID=345631 RepID=A0A562VHA2_9BACT|nr:hypothetical protein [Geobacter argillaceus]TWJ17333.1 hypothetical protein JN12_03109 [Geobacter argillaceus]
MISSQIIDTLITAATTAPTVDNCQPWQFITRDDGLDIHLDRQRAEFFGDYCYTAAYATIGAAVQNMVIAASNLNLACEVTSFPSPEKPVARITFRPSLTTTDQLFNAILQRCTNRRPYRNEKLDEPTAVALKQAVTVPGATLHLFDDHTSMKQLFLLAAKIDSIIFNHPQLHANLFRWLRWNDGDVQETRDGLPIGSLELDPFQRLFFRLMSSWPLLRTLNLIGINRLVGLLNSSLLMKSAALGILVMDGSSNQHYFAGGRCMERIWLTATAQGVAVHPFGGLPFILTRMLRGGKEGFSDQQYRLLKNTYARLQEIIPITPANALIILFRFGYADPPTQRSLRRPVSDVLQTFNG